MSAQGREREFAERNSGRSGAHRTEGLADTFLSVNNPTQTGR